MIACWLYTLLISMVVSSASAQMIPFAFLKQGPILNWDFTMTPTLPSQLTFTRASTATYFNSSGVMQTASANTPRFDYNPTTLSANGLLMEAAATNIIACSADINIGVCWNTEGATPMTVSANSAVAPDGTTTADRLIGAGDSWTYPTLVTTTANVPYIFSIYLKGATAGTVNLGIQEAAGAYQIWATQNVSVTTSWQRYSLTATKTNTNPMRFMVYLGSGHLGSVYAWGAQVELGTVPTSYIPTTSAAVTRAADSATFNTMTWFNPEVGTLFAEYVNLGAESATTYRVFGLFNTNVSGTFAANSIEISDNNTTVTSNVTATTAQFSPGGSLNAANTVNRQAISYKVNSFSSSINRGTVTTDSSGSLPATPAYGYIGSQPNGSIRNRYIRKIQYFNSQLRSEELKGL